MVCCIVCSCHCLLSIVFSIFSSELMCLASNSFVVIFGPVCCPLVSVVVCCTGVFHIFVYIYLLEGLVRYVFHRILFSIFVRSIVHCHLCSKICCLVSSIGVCCKVLSLLSFIGHWCKVCCPLLSLVIPVVYGYLFGFMFGSFVVVRCRCFDSL